MSHHHSDNYEPEYRDLPGWAKVAVAFVAVLCMASAGILYVTSKDDPDAAQADVVRVVSAQKEFADAKEGDLIVVKHEFSLAIVRIVDEKFYFAELGHRLIGRTPPGTMMGYEETRWLEPRDLAELDAHLLKNNNNLTFGFAAGEFLKGH